MDTSEPDTHNATTIVNDTNSKETIKDTRINNTKKKMKKRNNFNHLVPRIGCLKLKVEEDEHGNIDMQVVGDGPEEQALPHPTHLVVTVNGLIGRAENWKFAAKQLLRSYPRDVIVHCSQSNYAVLTFDGVDVMGDRLAKEVVSVVKRYPNLTKISFIGHSLGGLIARYAIAKLYECDLSTKPSQGNEDCETNVSAEGPSKEEKTKGRIAGLEPINFITSATPHLGSRAHKQVPMFCGSYKLEKLATRLSRLLGRSGKQLFLTDGKNGKPPLLLQMVRDSEDLKFMSALQSFKRRVAYANVQFDNLVGWSTSSLRHQQQLPKIKQQLTKDKKYRHVVRVNTSESALPQQEAPVEANGHGNTAIDIEEEMIRELTKLSWERVDVKFKGYHQRFLAHGTIQVQNKCMYSKGVDVIQHMVDNFLL